MSMGETMRSMDDLMQGPTRSTYGNELLKHTDSMLQRGIHDVAKGIRISCKKMELNKDDVRVIDTMERPVEAIPSTASTVYSAASYNLVPRMNDSDLCSSSNPSISDISDIGVNTDLVGGCSVTDNLGGNSWELNGDGVHVAIVADELSGMVASEEDGGVADKMDIGVSNELDAGSADELDVGFLDESYGVSGETGSTMGPEIIPLMFFEDADCAKALGDQETHDKEEQKSQNFEGDNNLHAAGMGNSNENFHGGRVDCDPSNTIENGFQSGNEFFTPDIVGTADVVEHNETRIFPKVSIDGGNIVADDEGGVVADDHPSDEDVHPTDADSHPSDADSERSLVDSGIDIHEEKIHHSGMAIVPTIDDVDSIHSENVPTTFSISMCIDRHLANDLQSGKKSLDQRHHNIDTTIDTQVTGAFDPSSTQNYSGEFVRSRTAVRDSNVEIESNMFYTLFEEDEDLGAYGGASMEDSPARVKQIGDVFAPYMRPVLVNASSVPRYVKALPFQVRPLASQSESSAQQEQNLLCSGFSSSEYVKSFETHTALCCDPPPPPDYEYDGSEDEATEATENPDVPPEAVSENPDIPPEEAVRGFATTPPEDGQFDFGWGEEDPRVFDGKVAETLPEGVEIENLQEVFQRDDELMHIRLSSYGMRFDVFEAFLRMERDPIAEYVKMFKALKSTFNYIFRFNLTLRTTSDEFICRTTLIESHVLPLSSLFLISSVIPTWFTGQHYQFHWMHTLIGFLSGLASFIYWVSPIHGLSYAVRSTMPRLILGSLFYQWLMKIPVRLLAYFVLTFVVVGYGQDASIKGREINGQPQVGSLIEAIDGIKIVDRNIVLGSKKIGTNGEITMSGINEPFITNPLKEPLLTALIGPNLGFFEAICWSISDGNLFDSIYEYLDEDLRLFDNDFLMAKNKDILHQISIREQHLLNAIADSETISDLGIRRIPQGIVRGLAVFVRVPVCSSIGSSSILIRSFIHTIFLVLTYLCWSRSWSFWEMGNVRGIKTPWAFYNFCFHVCAFMTIVIGCYH